MGDRICEVCEAEIEEDEDDFIQIHEWAGNELANSYYAHQSCASKGKFDFKRWTVIKDKEEK